MPQTRKVIISAFLVLTMAGVVFSLALMNKNLSMHSIKPSVTMVAATTNSSANNFASKGALGAGLGSGLMKGGKYASGPDLAQVVVSKLETDLNLAHVYPNPYKPNSTGSKFLATNITFSRLTGHVTVRVYDISGQLVYNTEQDTPYGTLTWDVTNNKGSKLASGVYIYLITDRQGHKAKGKVAVIK